MEKTKKLTIKKTDFENAELYSSKFQNNNFFSTPKHIKNFNLEIDWWVVYRGEEALCLWPIYLNENKEVNKPLFSYYFGPIWSANFKELSNHSVLAKKCEVLDTFINHFTKVYKNLFFQFDYNELDIRYFLWTNENQKFTNKKFIISPKYTSVIFDLDKKNKENILSDFRVLRKRMIKKFSETKDFNKESNFSLQEILSLYNDTITRKKNIVDKDANKFISVFHKMCQGGDCKMIGYRNKKNNEIVSVVMVALEKDTANLILNLSSHKYKDTGVSAFNMLESILYAKNLNCTRFDFNGANSQIGADDKQSYGGNSKLYFQIELR
tara:strand:- start:105 stop:1076 length:972 start_codon:yes stop_codon:yes gene_type:complete